MPSMRDGAPTPEVVKVHLLNPDGTATGDWRWDRKLRVDGDMRAHGGGKYGCLLVRFQGGEDGLWSWIAAHCARGRENDEGPRIGDKIWPIAVEAWARGSDVWRHWHLPRLNPQGSVVDPGRCGWPVVEWEGRSNEHWWDERFRETFLAFEVVEGRPPDAPEPLVGEEEAA